MHAVACLFVRATKRASLCQQDFTMMAEMNLQNDVEEIG
jgi:hypothetical protein